MALLALPVAAFDPAPARTLWLLTSLLAVAGSTFLLAREAHSRYAHVASLTIAVVLLSPAVFANLRTAQVYLVIGACFAGTTIALSRGRDVVAGLCIGPAVILKTAGVPWLLVLAAAGRWRALGVALATVTGVGLMTLPWTGLATWLAYPSAVAALVARPSTGVTAYQTTVGFARHWCVADPRSNEGAMAGCPTAATIVTFLLLGVAVAITVRAVRHAPPALASAAAVSLSLLPVPIAEDHQFVLLAVPLFALLATPAR